MISKNTFKKKQDSRLQTNKLSVSTIAQQIIEDVVHLYGREIDRNAYQSKDASVVGWWAKIGNLSKGKLVVVATRSQKLSEEFRQRAVQHVGLKLDQSVVMYSANDTLLRFARRMIDGMSGIAHESGIYDGQLNGEEFKKLSYALDRLSKIQLFMNQGRTIQLNDLYESAKKHQREAGEIGLILVDSVQQFLDSRFRLVDQQQCLIGLKNLAEELMVPILALYRLDTTVESHPSTLTYDELREVDRLAALTDGFMMMSGVPENIVIEPAKIVGEKCLCRTRSARLPNGVRIGQIR